MNATIQKPEVLVFDRERHEYRVGGRRLPSVTEVIRAVLPGWEDEQWYLDRGSAVHAACQFVDEGRVAWDDLDGRIRNQVVAWCQFRQDFPAATIQVELPLYDPTHWFAGKLDRVLWNRRTGYTVVDIKSSYAPQAVVQVAAYRRLWERWASFTVRTGCVVELRDDASYKAHWIERPALERADRVFLGALSVHGFHREHRYQPRERRRDYA